MRRQIKKRKRDGEREKERESGMEGQRGRDGERKKEREKDRENEGGREGGREKKEEAPAGSVTLCSSQTEILALFRHMTPNTVLPHLNH